MSDTQIWYPGWHARLLAPNDWAIIFEPKLRASVHRHVLFPITLRMRQLPGELAQLGHGTVSMRVQVRQTFLVAYDSASSFIGPSLT